MSQSHHLKTNNQQLGTAFTTFGIFFIVDPIITLQEKLVLVAAKFP
jgi:hypothetical protein